MSSKVLKATKHSCDLLVRYQHTQLFVCAADQLAGGGINVLVYRHSIRI